MAGTSRVQWWQGDVRNVLSCKGITLSGGCNGASMGKGP